MAEAVEHLLKMEQWALATFVAAVEQHSAVTEKVSSRRTPGHRFALSLVGVLTVAAFLIQGYHPFAEDGGLYLAGVERLLHPQLFAANAEFVLEPTRYSLFAVFVAATVRLSHLGLRTVLLLLQLGSIFATLFALWSIACRCWPERMRRAGAVLLAACWLSLPVAGSALSLSDPYLTARSISTPCILLAMAGMLDATKTRSTNRWPALLLWGLGLAVAAAMHPLMAGYGCAATLLLACLRSQRRNIRVWGTGVLAVASFAIAVSIYASSPVEGAAYRQVALTRTYWFPAQWAWYELLGLAAPLVVLGLFAMRNKLPEQELAQNRDAARSLYLTAIVAGATALVIAVCCARTNATTYAVARLQPLRVFQIVYFVMVLALGSSLGTLLRKHMERWLLAMLLFGAPLLIANRHAFSSTPHLELQSAGSRNLWVAAFVWIRDNTPVDALFALDPDYINAPGEDAQCFRAISERSSLPDYSKDGGEASIAAQLTAAWLAGQQAQHGLNDPMTTDDMRRAALEPLGVSWVILRADTQTSLNCRYGNAAVRVCKLR